MVIVPRGKKARRINKAFNIVSIEGSYSYFCTWFHVVANITADATIKRFPGESSECCAGNGRE